MIDAEYVLPLRWSDDAWLDELAGYLRELSRWVPVLVVDGSDGPIFERHARVLPAEVRHVAPEPWPGGNGKVAGVMTGLRRSRTERVVIADDDVRYTEDVLKRVVELLDRADVVRPANYFDPRPWHARWDMSRSLLNRALGSDYPGTLAVRRSLVLAAGGYAGDVLFENLELLRTIRAAGGREHRADDVLVRRLPPSAPHFLGQRVRQAYDDLAQPPRLIAELSILPLVVLALLTRRPGTVAAGALGLVALAESGRRRAGGTRHFPATSALWLPLWLAERGVCVWLALGSRLRGGARYSGGRLRFAATPRRELRRRVAAALASGGIPAAPVPDAAGELAPHDSRTVAEAAEGDPT